eukprot:13802623-Alexandrium_andersonii.AAC.1
MKECGSRPDAAWARRRSPQRGSAGGTDREAPHDDGGAVPRARALHAESARLPSGRVAAARSEAAPEVPAATRPTMTE